MLVKRFTIRPLEPDEDNAALQVMLEVAQELWGLDLDGLRQYDPLSDYEGLHAYYISTGGVFLAVVLGKQLIGTGGLRRIDAHTCELKRIWLLKAYRGQGVGRCLVQALLEFARQQGYQRVRLNVVTPHLQQAAVGLYTSMGFKPVKHQKVSGVLGLIMELFIARSSCPGEK